MLFSMVYNSPTFRQGEHWFPVCLPKFNSNGFLHAYIVFLSENTSLILISADKAAFYEMRTIKEKIVELLKDKKIMDPLLKLVDEGRYQISEVCQGPLFHFVYKSRSFVQYTMPTLSPSFVDFAARRWLMNAYHEVYTSLHSKSCQLKLIHKVTNDFSCLGWVTNSFELMCIARPEIERGKMVDMGRQVIRWIMREQERLFIVTGAVY